MPHLRGLIFSGCAAHAPKKMRLQVFNAMLETLQSTIADPAELIQFQVLLASINLWDADQLGYSDMASWEAMQTTLIELGSLDDAIDLEGIFTNQFVDETD